MKLEDVMLVASACAKRLVLEGIHRIVYEHAFKDGADWGEVRAQSETINLVLEWLETDGPKTPQELLTYLDNHKRGSVVVEL